MATYLVGDIQGCLDPLQRLLDSINFDPAADRLWPCGDLVNRGGDSLAVLRLLHSLGPAVHCVLGNHDLHLMADHARNPDKSKNKEFKKIMKAHDRDTLMAWLSEFPLADWSEEHQLLRVHAGVIPDWDRQTTLDRAEEVHAVLRSGQRATFLRKMYGNRPRRWKDELEGWKRLRVITNILTRMRFCNGDGRYSLNLTGPPRSYRKKGFKPWFKHPHRQTRDVRIAFGHWAALGLRIRKTFLALDSGCVWGGKLSAWRLEDDQLFQVRGMDW